MYKPFSQWLINERDIFGFENEVIPIPKKMIEEKPVRQLDTEQLINNLSRYQLGPKQPLVKFMNEVHWGFGTGAMRVRLNGKMKVLIERLNFDLNGNPRWICKKVYQLDRKGKGGAEEEIAQEVFDVMQKIDREEMDAPKNNYDLEEMENLIASMVNGIKRTASPIFIFEGVRKVNDYNYIVRLSLRGHGVEAMGHKKVEEYQMQVVYDKEAGLLRITDYRVDSYNGGNHDWSLAVPDHTLYFYPTQENKEIVDVTNNIFYWF